MATAVLDADARLLVEGKFGKALNGAWSGASAKAPDDRFSPAPFTLELWCRQDLLPLTYNFIWSNGLLVANEPVESSTHWRVQLSGLTLEGPGRIVATFAGLEPGSVESKASVADGAWHYVAVVRERERISIYIDGQLDGQAEVKNAGNAGDRIPGPLTVAKAMFGEGGVLTSNAQIDSVRLSSVAREIGEVPSGPFVADDATVGLWQFDSVGEGRVFSDAAGGNDLLADPDVPLQEFDRALFKAGPAPMDGTPIMVDLLPGPANLPDAPLKKTLGEGWQLATGAEPDWDAAIPAMVPGTVYTALRAADLIPEPYFAKNQDLVAPWAEKTFWYRTRFARPLADAEMELHFQGVATRCAIWLNGRELGSHEGMQSDFSFRVSDLLEDDNELVVRIDPAVHWRLTVASHNSEAYGAKLPCLGLWRPVELREIAPHDISGLFVATHDVQAGLIDLSVKIEALGQGGAGTLVGTVTPENFSGEAHHFEIPVESNVAGAVRARFAIPDVRLWWPNGIGDANLYRLDLAYQADDGSRSSVATTTFGVRTIDMTPLPDGVRPRWYNWTFTINGRPQYVKGANWCTPDAMLELSRERYAARIEAAKRQHIQIFRCWGCGLVETDDFYDLCDRNGILVMQEWPTAWDSAGTQPNDALEETARRGTLRLRNNPSLASYCPGNESAQAGKEAFLFTPLVTTMGRISIELDGTRPFWRASPYGGSDHNYDVYFAGRPIDDAFLNPAVFCDEFGIASYPDLATVNRFLPEEEQDMWPHPADGTLNYHTPPMGLTKGPADEDLALITRPVEHFTHRRDLGEFIFDTQTMQGLYIRHMVERARTEWPRSTGTLYFMFNDNSPAAGHATVDWHGTPKRSYYWIQKAQAPLAAAPQFPKSHFHGEDVTFPIMLLDDAGALESAAWTVTVSAYDDRLKRVHEQSYSGRGLSSAAAEVGDFSLSADQTRSAPLFFLADVAVEGRRVHRTWYFLNWREPRGCLFDTATTSLDVGKAPGCLTITNMGDVAAFGVEIRRKQDDALAYTADNLLWIDAGETVRVEVDDPDAYVATAWNIAAGRA